MCVLGGDSSTRWRTTQKVFEVGGPQREINTKKDTFALRFVFLLQRSQKRAKIKLRQILVSTKKFDEKNVFLQNEK